jgi:serine/threonine protein kinase
LRMFGKILKFGCIKLILFSALRYKHIVLSMGVTANQNNEILLVMEYMKNGSLHDLLFESKTSLKPLEIIQIALDVAKGLNYLHSLTPKILHRDMKSANVLVLYRNG